MQVDNSLIGHIRTPDGEHGLIATCDGDGLCGDGEVECRADGAAATCSTNPAGSDPGAAPEICSGEDEDCDGAVDEAGPATVGRLISVLPHQSGAAHPAMTWAGDRIAVVWHQDAGGIDQIRAAIFGRRGERLSVDVPVTEADVWQRDPVEPCGRQHGPSHAGFHGRSSQSARGRVLQPIPGGAGSQTLPVIASGEHGFAVAWVDEDAPDTHRGGISLLVGDLGCDAPQ